jgi:hypothetical protein
MARRGGARDIAEIVWRIRRTGTWETVAYCNVARRQFTDAFARLPAQNQKAVKASNLTHFFVKKV